MEELLSITDQSLATFLTRWYGQPDRPSESIRKELPRPLAEWLRTSSQWSRGIVWSSGPVDPPESEAGGERLVFWYESEGICEWAVTPDKDDPLVYERGESRIWASTRRSLSEFLLHVTVLDAGHVGSEAQCYAHGVSREDLEGIVSEHTPFPLPTLDCLSLSAEIFVGSETLVLISRSMSDLSRTGRSRFDVSLAATSQGVIDDSMARYPNIDWRRRSKFVPEEFSPDDLPGFLR